MIEVPLIPIYAPRLMVIAAFRYCLGRRTYIVGDCAQWLIANVDKLDTHDRKLIVREIDQQATRYGLGDECDVEDWMRVRDVMSGAEVKS